MLSRRVPPEILKRRREMLKRFAKRKNGKLQDVMTTTPQAGALAPDEQAALDKHEQEPVDFGTPWRPGMPEAPDMELQGFSSRRRRRRR